MEEVRQMMKNRRADLMEKKIKKIDKTLVLTSSVEISSFVLNDEIR